MANSKYLTLEGTAFWAKVFPENKDMGGEGTEPWQIELRENGGQYALNLELDEDSLVELTKSGSQAVSWPKTIVDDEGAEHVTYRLKRAHEKRNREGNLIEFASGPPIVVDKDKNMWDVESMGLIGNGSKIKARICVYKSGSRTGTRLEAIQVLDLVPYEVRDYDGIPF